MSLAGRLTVIGCPCAMMVSAAPAQPPRPGEVVSWGQFPVACPPGPFVSLSSGPTVVMAKREDGSIAIWGQGKAGPPGPFLEIAAGGWELDWSAYGLLMDGTPVRWGAQSGSPTPPPGPFVDVFAGGGWGCFLQRADGTFATWGLSIALAAFPGGSFTTIDSGNQAAIGVRPGGTLEMWGGSPMPNPPAGAFAAVSICYSAPTYAVAMRADGSLLAWGYAGASPPPAPAGQFKAVEVGDWFGFSEPPWAVGIRWDGSLVGWGSAPSGQAQPPSGKYVAVATGLGRAFALAGCYADCNDDGLLSVSDFGCYQTRFVGASPYADCTGEGLLTVADFGCFQTQYVMGCPAP